MKQNLRNYIIITPCKNEEWNFPNLIKSITLQTIKPVLWLIVNDGSTDKTGEILAQLESKYDWINCIHLKEHNEYLGEHYPFVCNKGFEFVKEYSKKNNINWEYIAILDADTIPEPEYFEKLIKKFEHEPRLGIACGTTCEHTENLLCSLEKENLINEIANPEFWQTYPFSLNIDDAREDLIMGSARIWRRKCFEETGSGYENMHAPDSISNVKAKMKGWNLRLFKDIKLIERKGSTAIGIWSGYEERGYSSYTLCIPAYMVLFKAINYSLKKPYHAGIAYIYGYFQYFISNKKRIMDPEIKQYYRHTHPTITINCYKEKLKIFFRNKSI
jgi:glycosyltransferase involved in cell wall biosynthesis